jgi:hypothetical protein
MLVFFQVRLHCCSIGRGPPPSSPEASSSVSKWTARGSNVSLVRAPIFLSATSPSTTALCHCRSECSALPVFRAGVVVRDVHMLFPRSKFCLVTFVCCVRRYLFAARLRHCAPSAVSPPALPFADLTYFCCRTNVYLFFK